MVSMHLALEQWAQRSYQHHRVELRAALRENCRDRKCGKYREEQAMC